MGDIVEKDSKPPAKLGSHIEGVSTERRFPRGGKLKVGELLTKCPACTQPNRVRLFEDPTKPICQSCGEAIARNYLDPKIRFKFTYPTAHPYFRFAPEPGNEHLVDRFLKHYGEEPKMVEAYLPLWPLADGRTQSFAEVKRELFYQSRQMWGSSDGKGIKTCEGDGITAYRINEKTRDVDAIDCAGPDCEFTLSKKCRIRGTLNLFLMPLGQPVIVQIDTGSPNNLKEINAALELLYYITQGKMYQPITLRVEIAKTRKGRAPFIHVSWPEELDLGTERLVISQELLELVDNGGYRALPEPGEPDPEDVAEEYNGEVPDEEKMRERKLNDLYGLVAEINANEKIITDAGMADVVRVFDDTFKPKSINQDGIAKLDIAVIEGVFKSLSETYKGEFTAYRKKQVNMKFG